MSRKFELSWMYWFCLFALSTCAIVFIMVSISMRNASAKISELEENNYQIGSQNQSCLLSISDYKSKINELKTENLLTNKEIENFEAQIQNLDSQLSSLNSDLNKFQTEQQGKFPFAVPTTGVLPNFASGYGENMRGMQHFAVDIWTTNEKYGVIPGHRGNPVYSACDGKVVSFDNENGAVTIACDEIPESYNVPAYKDIKTYYGHMGNGETKELFINVVQGQKIEKGTLIGYQGDLSKFFPEMRNVHLHFQLWSGQMEPLDGNISGPHNPCSYIGGNCNNPGEEFTAGSR